MAEKGNAENAVEAARMVDAIVEREKSSRSAVFRRLGITGLAPAKIMNGESCTDMMLERVRTEHARVCGGAVASKAAKSGMLVAPREEPAPAVEESDEDADAEGGDEDEDEDLEDAEDLEDDADEIEDDEDHSEDDDEPAPNVVSRTVSRPRFGPTVPGKGAPLLAPARSELHRAADVIAALGGIDNAERVVAIVLALKGAA